MRWKAGALIILLLAGCGTHPTFEVPGTVVDAPTPGPSATPLPRLTALPSEPFTLASDKAKASQGDPVNLVLVGSETQVRAAITAAGWLAADPVTTETSLKMAKATLFDLPYPNAPMSYLYLFGRKQDMGWQKNNQNVKQRDHFRVWKTPVQDPLGRDVWAVSASKDVGIRIIDGPTHIISPDVDAERGYVESTLEGVQAVADDYVLPAIGHPYRGKNGGGDPYQTDGMAHVLVLSPQS